MTERELKKLEAEYKRKYGKSTWEMMFPELSKIPVGWIVVIIIAVAINLLGWIIF